MGMDVDEGGVDPFARDVFRSTATASASSEEGEEAMPPPPPRLRRCNWIGDVRLCGERAITAPISISNANVATPKAVAEEVKARQTAGEEGKCGDDDDDDEDEDDEELEMKMI